MIVNYFEPAFNFDMTPEQALAYFQNKGLQPTFSYLDMIGAEHDKAFTVAKMMDLDLLGTVQKELAEALVNGESLQSFKNRLTPILQKAGWWGKSEITLPDGTIKPIQLGSAARIETIFRTNMQSAYAAGQWDSIQESADSLPYLMYDAVDDARTRAEHKDLDGKVFPVDHNFWKFAYPPNDYNCRCGVIQMDADMLESNGLSVSSKNDIEYQGGLIKGVSAQFNHNSGIEYSNILKKIQNDKIAKMPPKAADSAKKGVKANDELAKKYKAATVDLQAEKIAQQELAKAKAIENAQKQLDEISQGQAPKQAGIQKNLLNKFKKDGTSKTLGPVELLKKIQDEAQEIQEKKEIAKHINGYKNKVVAGKLPTNKQQQIFDDLPEAQQVKILADIDKQKAANLPPVPGDLNLDELKKIGGQAGSNPGGLYYNPETGKKYYIKFMDNRDKALNEVLAAKIYKETGIDVPEVYYFEQGGTFNIASEIIEGLESNGAKLKAGLPGIYDGFAVDAWLANWDVIGLTYDNMLVNGAKVLRVDTGGALRYRAQGSLKGGAFGDEVGELISLRDRTNPQANAVFGGISREDIIESARKVLAVSDDRIRELVRDYTDAAIADDLAELLIRRKNYIAAQYPEALKPRTITRVDDERITPLDLQQIMLSRGNGYSILTDKDQIEDNNVLFSFMFDQANNPFTHLYFKLRGDMADRLTQEIKQQSPTLTASDLIDQVNKSFEAAARSIAHKVQNDITIPQSTIDKVNQANAAYKAAFTYLKKVKDKPALDALELKLKPWRDMLEKNKLDQSAIYDSDLGFYKPITIEVKEVPETSGIKWERKTTSYHISEFDRGYIKRTGEKQTLQESHYEAQIKGVTVKYWSNDSDLLAMRGRVEIESPGNDAAAALKALEALEDIGIDTSRTTELYREQLYIQKLAYIHKLDTPKYNEILEISDDSKRLDELKRYIDKNLDNITKTPNYKPYGELQAFGHGRYLTYRPELLNDPEFERFQRENRLIHRNTSNIPMDELVKIILNSGGQMAPTTDKIRRGLPMRGMSPTADLRTGGASYFFTRINTLSDANRLSNGFVWKSRQVARMDAITYDSDYYGRTETSFVLENRKTAIDDFFRVARYSSNETIFKDSLSIFDDLESINVNSQAMKQRIILLFKANKIDRWPDGRELDEVIKVV